jgi:hypothetical protein
MRKYLLTAATLLLIGQAAFADDTATVSSIACPAVKDFQTLPLLSIYTSSYTGPARFDGKLVTFATTYKVNNPPYNSYDGSASWAPAISGVRANDATEASNKIKAILSHLSEPGFLKPLGNSQFACEYKIDPSDLTDYANSDTKPTVMLTTYVYLGNYLVAK